MKTSLFVWWGGNLGNIYMSAEHLRRDVISMFHNNKIVVFPQTMNFSNDLIGKIEFNRTKRIYSKHRYLYLFARERKSLNKMKDLCLWNQAKIAPDIVLSLKIHLSEGKRRGVLLCLRNDLEGVLSHDEKDMILNICREQYASVCMTDTFEKDLPQNYLRRRILEKKLNEFSSAQLVVTDRLHGMIFAVLTGTPCIVFDNCDGKVHAVYEWISYLKNIVFVTSISQFAAKIQNRFEAYDFDYRVLSDYYCELKSIINE